MRLIDAEPLEKILRSRCAQRSNDFGKTIFLTREDAEKAFEEGTT